MMMNKIFRDRSGETITEVLVSSLVVCLGVLLFAMMVQSSFRIVTDSETRMKDIYSAESNAESFASGTPGSITYSLSSSSAKGLITEGDITDTAFTEIRIYEDEKIETIKSYKK